MNGRRLALISFHLETLIALAVLLAIVMMALLILLVVVFCCIRKRKNQAKRAGNTDYTRPLPEINNMQHYTVPKDYKSSYEEPDYSAIGPDGYVLPNDERTHIAPRISTTGYVDMVTT